MNRLRSFFPSWLILIVVWLTWFDVMFLLVLARGASPVGMVTAVTVGTVIGVVAGRLILKGLYR